MTRALRMPKRRDKTTTRKKNTGKWRKEEKDLRIMHENWTSRHLHTVKIRQLREESTTDAETSRQDYNTQEKQTGKWRKEEKSTCTIWCESSKMLGAALNVFQNEKLSRRVFWFRSCKELLQTLALAQKNIRQLFIKKRAMHFSWEFSNWSTSVKLCLRYWLSTTRFFFFI